MAETAHYKLYINSDEKLKFKTFREEVAGETDSNMTKIDAALKAHDDALEGKQDKLPGVDFTYDAATNTLTVKEAG